jgi:hypothetical protein
MDTLNKQNAAHERQRTVEQRARLAMRSIWTLYAVVAVLTLAFRLWLAWAQCIGLGECAAGTVKSLIWMVFWPFYWMLYTNGVA